MPPPDERLEQLLSTPDLADVLESSSFRQFLDQVPIAIAVSELQPTERIVYANVEFERVTRRVATDLEGAVWDSLSGLAAGPKDGRVFGDAITEDQDFIGAFDLASAESPRTVDAWSNLIQDSTGAPVFRMLALVEVPHRGDSDLSDFRQRIHEKDVQLKELQHRVGNNLQMITALIRIEARNVPENAEDERFDRLAGRVEALGLLYRSLSEDNHGESIDLGVYLSQIASAVMKAHAVEGIHLDLQVDTWPVSLNVAMPTGLVVNELLTNALKHAFKGREGGTIKLRSLVDETGCRVSVSDDGVGLSPGDIWPRPGKLSALIVQSLRQNAKAQVEVDPSPGAGMRVSVFFARADAAPET